ncbi:hypothetical protein MHBO_002071 [Bonamia ostreae]|uniref:Uncharacterized protein n=1 Tax=Bonamia ostreae TaxID=126728 RepID=A0ABV2AL34_9EUKA
MKNVLPFEILVKISTYLENNDNFDHIFNLKIGKNKLKIENKNLTVKKWNLVAEDICRIYADLKSINLNNCNIHNYALTKILGKFQHSLQYFNASHCNSLVSDAQFVSKLNSISNIFIIDCPKLDSSSHSDFFDTFIECNKMVKSKSCLRKSEYFLVDNSCSLKINQFKEIDGCSKSFEAKLLSINCLIPEKEIKFPAENRFLENEDEQLIFVGSLFLQKHKNVLTKKAALSPNKMFVSMVDPETTFVGKNSDCLNILNPLDLCTFWSKYGRGKSKNDETNSINLVKRENKIFFVERKKSSCDKIDVFLEFVANVSINGMRPLFWYLKNGQENFNLNHLKILILMGTHLNCINEKEENVIVETAKKLEKIDFVEYILHFGGIVSDKTKSELLFIDENSNFSRLKNSFYKCFK